jgi:hypothetical protein
MVRIANELAEINRPQTMRVGSLDDLADLPRWVAWREEERERQDGSKYRTKIPYDPNRLNEQARIPTDPATWATRAQAERRWRKLDDGQCRGGIGIVLGDLGNGYYLLGVDLDHCLKRNREGIDVEPFINKIIDRFNTYAEVSPSGKGIKLFFLVAERNLEAVQHLLGYDHDHKPKTRKSFTAGQHLEIALDRARYYAVTDELVEGPETFRVVPVEDIRWFIAEAGPRFQQRHRQPGDERNPIRDESGSGFGYRYFASCKALHKTFVQAWNAILLDKGKAGDWARRVDNRQLQRAWDKARPFLSPDFVKPKSVPLSPTVTARELADMDFPPLKYIVPGVVAEGVTLFAGKPKVGKSWMMLQIAQAVANGGDTLGGIHCEQGAVLYCALEDNLRRLQSRMEKMRIANWSKHLHFRCDLPRLDEGGLDFIREWITTVKRPRLITLDTFQRVRSRSDNKESQYNADYEALLDLHALASEFGIAIVVVHHQRKLDADDPYDTVSGTFGLTAAADTIMLLRRDNSGTTILQARGRDVREIEKAVTFERTTGRWKIAGEAEEVRQSRQRLAVASAMRALGRPAKLNEIAGEAQLRPANVSKLLNKMARDGVIYRHDYGKYGLRAPRLRE